MSDNTKLKVNEIFCSLQGEGYWTGTPSVFLRFSGCNLKCDFCDTEHYNYELLSVQEIVSEINKYTPRRVVITGGEPTIQLSTEKGQELLSILKGEGYFIQIETNGTIDLSDDILNLIDWVTLSPKYAPVKLRRIDELKVVYEQQDFLQYKNLMPEFGRAFVQPCDYGDEEKNRDNLIKLLGFLLQNPQWRLSLQTHKMLSIR